MVEDARGRKLYVCLRCGNQYWSRAKKPQCTVCKSKKAMPYEDFLKLPEEEREKILGKKNEAKESAMKVNLKVPKVEVEEKKVETESEVKEILSEEEPKEVEEKRGEKPKVEKKSESPKVKKVEEPKVEKVKRGIPIPKPKFGLGVKALMVAVGLAYILYKLGFFESLINHLKTLGVFAKSEPKEEVEVERNPLLERVKKNLSG
ncbi:hypothetical protein TBCH5v1_2589 [Thermococcus barophilus]|uniref:Uncharacterized protein n=2 Tax=Thermococcus barophilus TaxID=55802 RepID=A0A0S1XFH7_THEBA|nr:hypothetical protein TBCH5v1_2589 [Thermococcus barophilus]